MEKVKKNGRGKMGKGVGTKIVIGILFAFLMFYVALMVFAIGWALNTSLKSQVDFNTFKNVLGLPNISGINPNTGKYLEAIQKRSLDALKLGNYQTVIDTFKVVDNPPNYYVWFGTVQKAPTVDAGIGVMLVNSIVYALGNSIIQVIALTTMGYMCAKYDYKFSRFLYVMVIVLMSLPIIGAYPAELTLLRNLNLYDTWYGNAMQKFGFTGMYFLVFYEYFKSTPDTYREAAEIDGASQLTVMLQIYVPMALKTIGSVILVRFVFHWNDYSSIRMYMPTHPTLSYGTFWNTIVKPQGSTPVKMASGMLLAVPIIVIFIIFQEKIMGSMTLGGIKE